MKRNQLYIILVLVICSNTLISYAQDIIIGSDEFYELYNWNVDTTFRDEIAGSGIFNYYYDIDSDGTNDIRFHMDFYRGSASEDCEKGVQTYGDFKVFADPNFNYFYNNFGDTSILTTSIAEPYYINDTLFKSTYTTNNYVKLVYYNHRYQWDTPECIMYNIDVFYQQPVFITLKKTTADGEYLYFLQIHLSLNSFNHLRLSNIYTTENYYTNIEQYSSLDKTIIYPNPASNYFIIPEEAMLLGIYSMGGNRFMSKNNKNDNEVDISSLSPGIYLIQIQRNNRIESIKLIKQ